MESPKHISLLPLTFIFVFSLNPIIEAQVSIPAKNDGFVYSYPASPDFISIDAFLDPVCPDSRDSWTPLKQVIDDYGPSIVPIVRPFPLPYHDNAFVTSRALHIVDKLNSSATFSLLQMFFEHQEEFSNAQTFNMSRASVVDRVMNFAAGVAGNSYFSAIQTGFKDGTTDLATRASFKLTTKHGKASLIRWLAKRG